MSLADSLIKQVLKQHKMSTHFGGIKDVLGQTIFYTSIINFTLIAITAYNTTIKFYAEMYVPWFRFWMFILALFIFVIIAMILEYKFVQPSIFAYRNNQEYSHKNPIRRDIAALSVQVKELEEKIEALKHD